MTKTSWLSSYSLGEEIANAITHGVGALLGIVALTSLIWIAALQQSGWHLAAGITYGVSLILLYTASTLYHAFPQPKIKKIFQKLDHSAIYLLIAGTYTPFLLLDLRGSWGWSLMALVWAIALGGIVLELTKRQRVKWLSLSLYLGLGWLALIAIKPMLTHVDNTALLFLLSGGLCYSVGVFFYVQKKIAYHHAIWHSFVLAGSVLHFVAVVKGPMLSI